MTPVHCKLRNRDRRQDLKLYTSVFRNAALVLPALVLFFAARDMQAQNAIDTAATVTYAGAPGTNYPGCGAANVWVEAHGIAQTALGAMFVAVRKCYFLSSFTYQGTFAMCLSTPMCPAGAPDSVSGTYAGADDLTSGDFQNIFGPFHGTLTITSATGRLAGLSGVLTFTAVAANGISLDASGNSVSLPEGMAYYAIHGAVRNR